jgi:ABC-type multidrug transport system fused ATPase/permease subunit
MMHKLFSLFKAEDKVEIYALIFALFVSAMLEMIGVSLIMPFIAIIQSPDMIDQNKYAKLTYEITHASSYNNFIIYCSLIILVFYLLKNVAVGWVIYWQSKFLAKAESEISANLLSKYLVMPYEQFLSRNTAQLVNNVTMETAMLFAGLIKPLFIVISDTLVVIAILFLLVYIAPAATMAAMGATGICAVVFYVMLRERLKTLGKERLHHREQMIQWVNQSLGSLKEIIVLGRKDFFINAFWKHAYEMIGQQTFYETVTQLPRIIIESFGVIVLVVITIILLHQQGEFLPTIAVFAMAAFRLMPAINRITASATKVRYYTQTLNVIYDDFQIQSAAQPVAAITDKIAKKFQDEIILQDVCYSYPATEKQVLQNINLSVKKGDSVGIIGQSGAGKSTLVDILLGLLPAQNGQIMVDGIDIQQDIIGWRRHISYMPQVVYLTDDTIKRNVALGIPDDEIDEALVWESLKKAQADEFVRSQESGLETLVGERGSRLSGGQRQRIGIARALYNQPDILILDEATTALDPETEKRICNTLTEIAKDITIIAISHQPALIAIADKVYRMEKGKLTLQ